MIRVTIYNEYLHEQMSERKFSFMEDWDLSESDQIKVMQKAKKVQNIHRGGIHLTLSELLMKEQGVQINHVAMLEQPECGLTEEVLSATDVLLWWSHLGQELVPDAVAERVRDYVQRGMGIVFLHSAHASKPMRLLLGTSCTLRWREGDSSRIWCCNPAHPIAKGVPPCVWLEDEEMYGEFFDIPAPDELVFLSSFSGGEVFRSGCVWNRGYGKIFYFQPGHETNHSYFHPDIRKIIRNAVRYVARGEAQSEPLVCIPV